MFLPLAIFACCFAPCVMFYLVMKLQKKIRARAAVMLDEENARLEASGRALRYRLSSDTQYIYVRLHSFCVHGLACWRFSAGLFDKLLCSPVCFLAPITHQLEITTQEAAISEAFRQRMAMSAPAAVPGTAVPPQSAPVGYAGVAGHGVPQGVPQAPVPAAAVGTGVIPVAAAAAPYPGVEMSAYPTATATATAPPAASVPAKDPGAATAATAAGASAPPTVGYAPNAPPVSYNPPAAGCHGNNGKTTDGKPADTQILL